MHLTLKERASYGLGACGKDMAYMLSANYVLYYYQDIMGIPAMAIGVILLVARVFDAFNDPLMGIVVAKTKTRWGRFRPWLMIGAVTNAIILYFMYAAPPALSGNGLVAYAAIFYILWGTTYTLMDIPFWSMIPAFTEGGSEREHLSALGRSCAGVGDAIITIITMKCVLMLGHGDEHEGFRLFALFIAVCFILFTLLTCLAIKEKSTVDVETASVKEMFRALLRNDQAMTIVIVIVLINLSFYMVSNLLIYFFKYDMAGAHWADNYTLFNTFGGGIQILSMMIAYPLFRKFRTPIQIFHTSVFMAIFGFLILFGLMSAGVDNLLPLLIPAFLIFLSFGLLTVLTTVFLANTVDYGEVKNGRRDDSVIFSMQTFVVKLASGLAALIASIALTICHISKDAATLSAGSSLAGLRVFMTILPVLGFLIAFAVFRNKFRLTQSRLREINEKLRQKREA